MHVAIVVDTPVVHIAAVLGIQVVHVVAVRFVDFRECVVVVADLVCGYATVQHLQND